MFLRRWVLWSFVLLMPFRLWAADAMALDMQMAPESHAQALPCHEHTDEDIRDTASQETHATHHFCLHCDVCHQAMSLPPGVLAPSSIDPPHVVTTRASPIDSAERFPSFKPPIL